MVATRAAAARDRFDAYEPGTERAGCDQERRGSLDALLRHVGDSPRPGERRAGRVVDRHAGLTRVVGGQRLGGDVEQAADARLIARRVDAGLGPDGHAGGDRGQAAGAAAEPIAHLGAHALDGGLVGGAEAAALERVAGRTGDERGCDAGAHDAHDEGHVSPQDTRVL